MSHFCKPTRNCSPQARGSDGEGSRHRLRNGTSLQTPWPLGEMWQQGKWFTSFHCASQPSEETILLLTGWQAGCEMQPPLLRGTPYWDGDPVREREGQGQKEGKL